MVIVLVMTWIREMNTAAQKISLRYYSLVFDIIISRPTITQVEILTACRTLALKVALQRE